MNITVLGDIMIDETINVERVKDNPECEGGSIYRAVGRTLNLGGAALTAKLCSRLEANVFLLSIFGDDYYGSIASKLLLDRHIFGAIKLNNYCTIVKTRYYCTNKFHADRFDFENTEVVIPVDIREFISHELQKADNILVSDYNKGAVLPTFIEYASKATFYAVDPAYDVDWTYYGDAHLIKCNMIEAAKLEPRVKVKDLAKSLYFKYQIPTVVTMGARGMQYCSKAGAGNIGAPKLMPTKIYGAGDAVFAAICIKLIEGTNLEAACEFASQFVSEQICQK